VSSARAEEIHYHTSRRFLSQVQSQGAALFCPGLVLPECAAAIARPTGDAALGGELVALIEAMPGLQLVHLDSPLAHRAAEIAARHRLRGADAVYVAVAEALDAALITWCGDAGARCGSCDHNDTDSVLVFLRSVDKMVTSLLLLDWEVLRSTGWAWLRTCPPFFFIVISCARWEYRALNTGLVFLRARWYDPRSGRFVSKDPFPGYASLPQTLNGYAYCLNNSINIADAQRQKWQANDRKGGCQCPWAQRARPRWPLCWDRVWLGAVGSGSKRVQALGISLKSLQIFRLQEGNRLLLE